MLSFKPLLFRSPPSADAVAAARAAWEPQVPANNPFGRRRPAHVVANGGESVVDINVSFFSFFFSPYARAELGQYWCVIRRGGTPRASNASL